MSSCQNVLQMIGNTPLVEIRSLDTGPCRLLVKLESQNPGGSIKDRIGRSMIEAAERDGRIRPGSTLVEATAGNTGLGLALVAAQKGYRLILVIPDKMSQEKVLHLKALGAEVVMTRSDVGRGHPQYYQDMAEEIARQTPNAFYVNQFNNPANPLAHETTTGPEIWDQTGHDLDAIVCGVGSGGTITGLSRFFARVAPQVEMVLADPLGSVLADYVQTGRIGEAGSWAVEGIGEDFVPPIADLSRVRTAYRIGDAESLLTARDLLRREGILAGSSSGTLVAAALRYCREQSRPKRVVTLVCDSGNKYLSKMFNDFWMADRGFLTSALVRRPARRDQPPLQRGGRGERRTRRPLERRLHPHENVRRVAGPGPGWRGDRRHPRRVGPALGRDGRCRRARPAGPRFHDHAAANRPAESVVAGIAADLRRGTSGDRRRRGRVLRADHPRGRAQSPRRQHLAA